MAMFGVGVMVAAGCGDECSQGATRCVNNAVQFCAAATGANGYAYAPTWHASEDCGAEAATCIQPRQTAFCALSTDQDPLCAGTSTLGICGGDDVVQCIEGYRIFAYTCGTGDGQSGFTKCVVPDAGRAVCVSPEAMADDVCARAGTVETVTSYCAEGGIRVYCLAGLAVARTACQRCDGAITAGCIGFLGDDCTDGRPCAAGLDCHPDSAGTQRCTAACDPTDPDAITRCEDLFLAGGPRAHPTTVLTPGTRMTCTAGLCEWAN